MGNPWVAVGAELDLVAWARLLRRAHDLSLSKGTSPSIVRDVIADSWARCMSAGVDPERAAPKILDQWDVNKRLEAHPLARQLPLIKSLLADTADAGQLVIALSDADGLLLWADGHRDALRRAEKPHFRPGFLCSEDAVGTNAIGTALAMDHAVQIFSAEHFNRLLHTWTCAAAPIHDPESTAVLGALNISGSYRGAHPQSLALVAAVARAVESDLARDLARRDERLKAAYVEHLTRASQRRSALITNDGRVVASSPAGWLREPLQIPAGGGRVALSSGIDVIADPVDDGRAHVLWQVTNRRATAPKPALRLEALGKARVSACFMGGRTVLGPRHSEILVLLALHPQGMSGKDIAMQLYNAPEKRVTVRAEMSRLRKLLGSTLAANPYRLLADVRADFLDVQRLAEDGAINEAHRLYSGTLLPASDVPAIVAARERLEKAVRRRCTEPPGGACLARRTQLPRRPNTLAGVHLRHARHLHAAS